MVKTKADLRMRTAKEAMDEIHRLLATLLKPFGAEIQSRLWATAMQTEISFPELADMGVQGRVETLMTDDLLWCDAPDQALEWAEAALRGALRDIAASAGAPAQ